MMRGGALPGIEERRAASQTLAAVVTGLNSEGIAGSAVFPVRIPLVP